jgi:hypothetical protein
LGPKLINILKVFHRHSYVFIILLLGLISLTWYHDKQLLWGDDTNLTLDAHLIETRYFYLWDSNVGKADALKLPYIMPQAIILRFVSFLNIPFSPAVFERILLYSVFTGSGLSMYYLSILFIPSNKAKRLGAVVASAFYMFNFYTMTTILPSGAMIMFEYAFFPLVLALYIRALDNSSSLKNSIVIALVWTVLITPAYITATVALTDWIVIVAYFLFFNISKHDKKTLKSSVVFTCFLLAIWTLMNLFWILPLVQTVPAVQQSYSSFSSGIDLYAANSISVLDGLRLMGYWGLTATFRGAAYYPWYTHFQTFPFVLSSFLLPVIVGVSLLLNSRNSRLVLFFGMMTLLGLFVVKGLNPPLGSVNKLLFSINLLSTTFRSNYQRIVGYLTLFYAFLFGAFVSKIYCRPKKIWSRGVGQMIGIILLVFLIVGVLAWPVWTGDVFSTEGIIPSKRVTIPQYYYEAAAWLDQQNEDFSVLPLPYPAKTAYSALWWENGTEGYYGTYPFLLLSSKTFLLTNNLAGEVALSFSRDELKDSQVLNYFNVKYIAVHWDTNWEYVRDHDWWVLPFPQNLSAYLANVQGLSLEKSFGEIDFYRNFYWKPQKAQTISKAEYLNASLSSLIPILGMGAFEKRMEISVQTENAASAVDLVIPLNISYQDGISPDFSNVLFTYFNETSGQETKIFHWIKESESNQSAVVWIKVPAFDKNGNCRLFLYYGGNIARAIDALAVKNPIGTDFHSHIVKVQTLWSLSNNVTCVKNSPTKYHIDLNITEPSYLVFCEPFENGWNIKGNPTAFEHIAAFDSLNGWSIDASGNYSISVVYGPQKNLEFGLIISIAAFAAGSIFLLINFRRSFLSRIQFTWTSRLLNITGNILNE